MQRQSADKDAAALRADQEGAIGEPPAALRQAWLFWNGAAVAALISVLYGFINLGTVTDAVRQYLQQGEISDPQNAAPDGQVDSLASFFPPAMLIATLVLLAIEYPLLVATSRNHSRNCRNCFATVVVVNLLCIPIGIDLLFAHPQISGVIAIVGWVQFALLVLSVLCTYRKAVGEWLPASMRMRPPGAWRAGRH